MFKTTECPECKVEDNENHRINHCGAHKNVNRYASIEKINFSKVYSDNIDELNSIADDICKVWDLNYGLVMME